MNTEDKIQRFAVDPNKQASYKARKFLRILTGVNAATCITYKALNREVARYSKEEIAKAREKFKGMKRASKYLRALCSELNATGACQVWTRVQCEEYLEDYKSNKPAEYKAAKAKLKGYSYEH